MPDWYEELRQVFVEHVGREEEIGGNAYDTAWVASLPDPEQPNQPAFPEALEWLRLHQLSDGSWGAEIEYSHDRVLCTLMAILALAKWNREEWVTYQISAGVRAIWAHFNDLQRETDPVGFELILPTLLDQAKELGFQLPYAAFDQYRAKRQQKLELIPHHLLYSRDVTSAFSIEFLGNDVILEHLNHNLQEDNGGIATSPSATSYFLMNRWEPRAMEYLRRIVHRTQGAIPASVPVEIFERAWALNNVFLVKGEFPPEAIPHLDALEAVWSPKGVGHSRYYSPVDLDDSALAVAALARAGRRPSPEALFQFETDDHFLCYAYERGVSAGVHVHILDALKALEDFDARQRMTDKTVGYLAKSRIANSFWLDKWHTSPYYITAHAVVSLIDLDPSLIENSIVWLIYTQRPDGGWGYRTSTAEETAHVLQALVIYQRHGGNVPPQVFQQGVAYLEESAQRKNQHYRPLWLCKVMYSPTWIVHTSVLSALAMVQQL
jgi:halimadienyl-diphosphate synthase